eukprot:TRINITY_DN16320_c0_g1_i2.p1 TRINITY_DN16320_c0_g1~~TRINITY_DN16320_c0_g1_i2.p1  ORF type:complete len:1161 (+),score=296.44 TRINITY_DN16320_c0_g1_i2:154-3483(+)
MAYFGGTGNSAYRPPRPTRTPPSAEAMVLDQDTQPATRIAHHDFPTATPAPRYCSGLRNQGATCYLNGLLQSLYHLSALREAVYRLKVADADVKGDQRMGLALQRLWWAMQTGDTAGVADTTELTRSFGWDPNEHFRQHDIQELLMVWVFGTLEALFESQMPEDNIVHRLFRGERRAQIKVPALRNEQGGPWTTLAKGEPFTDIQVDIRTSDRLISNLEDGLRYMLRPEQMDGHNKYRYDPPDGGNPTWHDAERSDMLTQLPPVLFFHLRRFGRTAYGGGATEKVRERYEFPAELNMAPFQQPQGDEMAQDEAWYDLHAVMVHSGTSAGSGHYYAFVRLRGEEGDGCAEPTWFKFDDSRVTVATEREAVGDNYGGYETGGCRTAYLLMYVRRSEARDLVYKPREDVVPDFVARDKEVEDERRRQEELRCSSCLLTVFTAKQLASDRVGAAAAASPHGLASLYTDERSLFGDEKALAAAQLTVRKADTLDHVYQEVGTFLGLAGAELERLRLWICPAAGQSVPMRPEKRLPRGDAECAYEFGLRAAGQIQCTIFAEWEEAVGAVESPALVIVREYCGKTATLQFSGCRVVNARTDRCGPVCNALLTPTAQSTYKTIWRTAGAARGADLCAPERVEEGDLILPRVELLVCQRTQTSDASRWLQDRRPSAVGRPGDTPEELRGFEQPSLVDFLVWRRQSYVAMVRPRDGSDEGSQLRLLRNWKRQEILAAVAQHLQRPPVCLRLQTTAKGQDGEMLELMPYDYQLPKDPAKDKLHLWYEVIADRPEDAGKHSAKVEARDAEGNVLGKGILVLPSKTQCRMEDLLCIAQQRWPELGDPAKLNLVEVCHHAIITAFGFTVLQYPSPWAAKADKAWAWNTDSSYRVEPIPPPVPMHPRGATSQTVSVCHYWRLKGSPASCYMNKIMPFGDPFRLAILDTDTASDVLLRARKQLGLCAEPALPPGTPSPQRAGCAVGVTSPMVLHESGHVAATTDDEEELLLQRALRESISPRRGGEEEGAAPAEEQAPPADKRTPDAAPGDDGSGWHVAVLTKRSGDQDWSEGRELGRDEKVWKRVRDHTTYYKVTVGLEHAPPSVPKTERQPVTSAGVVMNTDV